LWSGDIYSIHFDELNIDSRYDLKPGILNSLNIYSGLGESSYEYKFPLIFSIEIINHVSDQLCWQGILYLSNKNNIYEKQLNKTNECIILQKSEMNNNTIFALDYEGAPELKIYFKNSNIYLMNLNKYTYYLKIFLLILLSIVSFRISFINIFSLLSINLSYFIFFIDLISSGLPSRFNPFVYLQRGNDGIFYYTNGRQGLGFLENYDFFQFFQAGQPVYYFMPGMVYLSTFLLSFFGETLIGNMLITSLIPYIIFLMMKKIINQSTAIVMFWFFLLIPIFESFGFLQFYYAKLTLKGFGGSFGYLFLFLAVFFLIPNNLKNIFSNKYRNFFISGFCLFLTILFRPNYLTFCAPILLSFLFLYFYNFINYKKENLFNIFFLFMGFSPFLLIPLHNYYFGNQFVLLTSSSTISANLKTPPSEIISAIKSLIFFNPNFDLIFKIFKNISTWINYYEFWLMIVYANLWFCLIKCKNNVFIRIVSFSLIISHFNYIFYAGDPRYVYGLWCLSFIVFLYNFDKNKKLFNKFKILNFLSHDKINRINPI